MEAILTKAMVVFVCFAVFSSFDFVSKTRLKSLC